MNYDNWSFTLPPQLVSNDARHSLGLFPSTPNMSPPIKFLYVLPVLMSEIITAFAHPLVYLPHLRMVIRESYHSLRRRGSVT